MSILFWASTNPTTKLGLEQKLLEGRNELKTWIKFPQVKASFLFVCFSSIKTCVEQVPTLKESNLDLKIIDQAQHEGAAQPQEGHLWLDTVRLWSRLWKLLTETWWEIHFWFIPSSTNAWKQIVTSWRCSLSRTDYSLYIHSGECMTEGQEAAPPSVRAAARSVESGSKDLILW